MTAAPGGGKAQQPLAADSLDQASDPQASRMSRPEHRRASPWVLPIIVLMSFPVMETTRSRAQSQIDANFPREDWQPTRAVPGAHYVGSKVCATCHVAESSTQPSTPMANAMSPIAECQALQSHPRLGVRLGRYSYLIATQNGDATYTVRDGSRSISATLLWAFGQGGAGQTYIYRQNGAFYESRVSYFKETSGLDLTLGVDPDEPQTLEAAAGRPLRQGEVAPCFSCHATASVGEAGLQLKDMTPGITCEGCHGAGDQHVAAVRSGKFDNLHIFNPGKLETADLVDFCGSCHRTPLDVAKLTLNCVATVRFQPYRLLLSRCFESGERRISCLACHNPHQQVERNMAFYDAKCLACHGGPRRSAPVRGHVVAQCRVARANCVSCHMPRYELPGGHFKFTDHDIQITRPGAPCRG